MNQRVLQGAQATLTMTLADQDGNAADAVGPLTVAVAAADGTVIVAAGTATTHGSSGSGQYSVGLTSAQTAQLNLLTATWTDAGAARTVSTLHEIVGGYLFTLADARASNDGLIADKAKYPDALVLATRQEVEEEAEWICDVAFVPRYSRVTLDGEASPEIVVPDNYIRVVRSVRTYPITGQPDYVAFTADQLAALSIGNDGTLRRTDFAAFDEGRSNIVIEYEHGWSSPPSHLQRGSLTRLRSRLNWDKTAVNERATSFTAENGQTYKLSTADEFSTGIPEVDAAYSRYSLRRLDDGAYPASRQLSFEPQRYSVFHQRGLG